MNFVKQRELNDRCHGWREIPRSILSFLLELCSEILHCFCRSVGMFHVVYVMQVKVVLR